MEAEYNYVCPECSKECSVPESLTGQNLVCPNCSHEFFATPPEPQQLPSTPPPLPERFQSHLQLPEKLPFFKSGRRKILAEKFDQLVGEDGIDEKVEKELDYLVATLGLEQSDLSQIRKDKFAQEFDPCRRKMESSWMMTDEDLEVLQRLEKKYKLKATMVGNNEIFRAIYLLEVKGQMPKPIAINLMLEANEIAYYSIPTTWHQTRMRTRGYSGTSVSVPTGIKGVRFRFGGYTPIRSEEIAPLSNGILYVTSDRLLFNGQACNTSIKLNKILDCHIFSDCVRVEKSTGKPDSFTMNAAEARYILALVGVLKQS